MILVSSRQREFRDQRKSPMGHNKNEKSFVIFLRLESLDRYITDFDWCKYVVLFKEAISDTLSGIVGL